MRDVLLREPGAAILEALGLTFHVAGSRLLEDVALRVHAGECVAVMGPSGVGKTSLLNCLAGIAPPAAGSVVVDGVELSAMPARRRAALRLRRIGLVFQFAELLPELTVIENVALPSRLMGMTREDAEARAASQLARFNLDERSGSHPDELSGGQQQLVGLARALVHEPVLVLADEPTGMLDETSTERVADHLVRASRAVGAATVIVTHDPNVGAKADRVLRIADGGLWGADGSSRAPAAAPVVEQSL